MLSQTVKGLFRGIGIASLCLAFLGSKGGPIGSVPDTSSTDDCIGCHKAIGDDWAAHAHGQAATNEAFTKAWNEEGNLPMCMTCHATGYDASTRTWESPGVSCLTCHGPNNENHPAEIMPTDVSTRVCGNCHLDTFLQFQDSAHSATGQTCYGCHNAHTTSLTTENDQDLCQTCHQQRVHSFELTVHAANGLSCSDCHLGVLQTNLGIGHGIRDHTFKVNLETCVGCHGEGLHAATQLLSANTQNAEETPAKAFPAQASLQTEPERSSLIGLAVLGPLFGIGFGVVVAPWLEKWYRQFRSRQ